MENIKRVYELLFLEVCSKPHITNMGVLDELIRDYKRILDSLSKQDKN